MNGSLSVPIKLTEISLINMEDYSRKDVWEICDGEFRQGSGIFIKIFL
jgi:hypothetical protein